MLLQVLTGFGRDSLEIASKIKEGSLEQKEPQIINILSKNITKDVLKEVRAGAPWKPGTILHTCAPCCYSLAQFQAGRFEKLKTVNFAAFKTQKKNMNLTNGSRCRRKVLVCSQTFVPNSDIGPTWSNRVGFWTFETRSDVAALDISHFYFRNLTLGASLCRVTVRYRSFG